MSHYQPKQDSSETPEPEFEPCALCDGPRDSPMAIFTHPLCYPCADLWDLDVDGRNQLGPKRMTSAQLTEWTREWIAAKRKARSAA